MTTTNTHAATHGHDPDPEFDPKPAPGETTSDDAQALPGEAAASTPNGSPPDADWVAVEPWAAFPPPPVPIPVLAPYLGLVAAVLCMFGGGWLLLAPYALDFRHGASRLPRAAVVDLETGAAIITVAVAAALLFSVNLALRLRTDPGAVPAAETEAQPQPETESESEPATDEPAAAVAAEPERPKDADPAGALRELLTPLVAALAADLRSHDRERLGDQQQRKGP